MAIENENDDPVGFPPRSDPINEFRNAATEIGLIQPGDPIDGHLVEFAYKIVERCASAVETFKDDDNGAADSIRAELGEH